MHASTTMIAYNEEPGTVALESWNGEQVLTIFVNDDGTMDYLKAWGPNIWDEMSDGFITDGHIMFDLWQWWLGTAPQQALKGGLSNASVRPHTLVRCTR